MDRVESSSMDERRGPAAIDRIERPSLPSLPPAILAVRDPEARAAIHVPALEAPVVEETPIPQHEAVEVVADEAATEEVAGGWSVEPAVAGSAPVVEDNPALGALLGDSVDNADHAPVEAASSEEQKPKKQRKQRSASRSSLSAKKLLVGLFAAFVAVFAVAAVQVTGILSNTSLVTSLEASECIENFFPSNDGEFREVLFVRTTNCTNPHAYEVFAVGSSVFGESEYPGVEAVFAQAQSYCQQQYSSFIGGDFATSPWEVWTFAPTEGRWDDGERSVQCIVGNVDQETLRTGTLKDAGL